MATTSSLEPPTRIRTVTLNCWGLKFLSKLRNERLTEIGVQLAAANPQPDIVGLQECWTQQDYLAIREKTRHFLPYGKFYHSGIFGGGLVILSRWPIEESNMLRYPLNGRPAAFYRGDWFVGKGVASARIRYGAGRKDVAEVFCTHLHAPYEKEPFDSYLCHRTAQAWEIAKAMRHACERGHLVIGLGDFNMRPLSLAHQIIETQSPTRDIWRVLHPHSSLGAAKDQSEQKRGVTVPSAEFNLTENGAASDNVLNTWRWEKEQQKKLSKGDDITVPLDTPDPWAKRLDYIFASCGEHGIDAAAAENNAVNESTVPNGTVGWAVESVNVGMTQRHPRLKCSLSDHFSVEATLVRTHNQQSQNSLSSAPLPLRTLPTSTFDSILDMITSYTARERRQRRQRLAHFLIQFFLAICCLVAVWWSPRNFVSFLLMLLSSLGLAAGVVDGLMGGLFVGSELRALKEFEWEVRNARERSVVGSSKTTMVGEVGGAKVGDGVVPVT